MPNAVTATEVALEGSMRVLDLEHKFVSCEADPDQLLLIDLRKVTYIEPVALLYLLSVLAARLRTSGQTKLRLPTSHRVRDFLRAWSFPAAFCAATATPFSRLVMEEDLQYFGEGQTYYTESPEAQYAGDLLKHLEGRRFFGLMTYRIHASVEATRAVEDEWSRWRTPLIMQVLSRHIQGPYEDVARVLIYELFANAIQHPQAKTATVVSSVGRRGSADSRHDASFAISVWDDGIGVADTLRKCLEATGTIRITPARSDDSFSIRAEGWEPNMNLIESSWDPPTSAENEELLLASLFSGISQKAARQTLQPVARPDTGQPDREAGNGLYSLYKSVVNDFGGTLSIRSGRSFLNLRRDGESAYKAKIVRYIDSHSFYGNMFTVRIPLRGQ